MTTANNTSKIKRVDAHQHFWRYTPEEYSWMDDRMTTLRRDYLPNDLLPVLLRHGMDGSIAVQARADVKEKSFLLELARDNPQILGVVGWLDFRAKDVESRLERWNDHRVMKGYRYMVQDEKNPSAFLASDDFNAGISVLQKSGKLYELLIHSKDLPAAAKFCARHDKAPIALCHMGKPSVRNETVSEWLDKLALLARYEHVHCKISGLVTEACWKDWRASELIEFIYVALDLFGSDRVMFGSDWPVCLCAADVDDVYKLAESASLALTQNERELLWGRNAIRLYGL
jgi:L-fuconolactonase